MTEVARLADEFDVPVLKVRPMINRILEGGFDDLGDRARGVAFWQEVWKAIRLEERLVQVEDLPDFPFPDGLDAGKLEDILQEAPSDFRFHLSSGALESFVNTLPLLHPRGYLQVQDIFVTDLNQYRLGFYGPGKLDGSLVELGQRCFTERGGGARRVQRALRAFPLPQRIADVGSLHDARE